MSWGSKAEVLEPQYLREEIRAEAEAAIEKYSRTAASQEESARA
jgi:predicted DNA-binding transcriptional regulator YafY